MAVNGWRTQASREVHHPVHVAVLDLPTINYSHKSGYKLFDFQPCSPAILFKNQNSTFSGPTFKSRLRQRDLGESMTKQDEVKKNEHDLKVTLYVFPEDEGENTDEIKGGGEFLKIGNEIENTEKTILKNLKEVYQK